MAKKARKPRRIVVISDLHCGHRTGLTPPGWQLRPQEEGNPQWMKWVNTQKECWSWYAKTITELKPIEILFVMGDCIDGTGSKSGGTELITTDRDNQVDMALKCIRHCEADKIVMVRGTCYHTGDAEDWEDTIAGQLQCKIGDHEWPVVNGVTFDLKHFIPSSTVPYGRQTPLAKDVLWNDLWGDAQPTGDIYLRGHVHYHVGASGLHDGKRWEAMTCPALQGLGTKFGARKCSSTVNFGLIYFDINERGGVECHSRLARPESQKARALIL